MKKSLLLSVFIHLTLAVLILLGSQNKKKYVENVYVVDLLSLPSSIEISNHIISNNVISSLKPEPAEASVITQTKKGSSVKTIMPEPDRMNAGMGEFSAQNYMAEINKKLTQYSDSSTKQTSENLSQKQKTSFEEKTSLASKIFPLNPKESKGISVDFHETGIPQGSIIPLEYLDGIKIAIQRNWKLPHREKNYSLIAVVSFKLHRDGTITDICLESSSGIKEFDESTVKAVKETRRISPLPDTYRPDSLEIAVKFNAREVE